MVSGSSGGSRWELLGAQLVVFAFSYDIVL